MIEKQCLLKISKLWAFIVKLVFSKCRPTLSITGGIEQALRQEAVRMGIQQSWLGKEVMTKRSALRVAFKEQRYENIWGAWYPLASVSGKIDTAKMEFQDQKQNSRISVMT